MKKLWVENIPNLPAVVWAEQAPNQDFADKTNDIIAWDLYGKKVLDLDRYRYEMKAPFYAEAGGALQNWATLSVEKKLIGAKYFFVPYALRITVITDAEDEANWTQLVEETQGTPVQIYRGRAKTFDEMRKRVAQYVRKEQMSMTNSQQMLKDVGLMVEWYIHSNSPDFKQWLTNEVGSPYEADGFAQKPYYSLALKNELYDIYNGNY